MYVQYIYYEHVTHRFSIEMMPPRGIASLGSKFS